MHFEPRVAELYWVDLIIHWDPGIYLRSVNEVSLRAKHMRLLGTVVCAAHTSMVERNSDQAHVQIMSDDDVKQKGYTYQAKINITSNRSFALYMLLSQLRDEI